MLSFFCRARSALKTFSSQSAGSKAKPVRLVGLGHSAEVKDFRRDHPTSRTDKTDKTDKTDETDKTGKKDSKGELIWLGSHRVNGINNRSGRNGFNGP